MIKRVRFAKRLPELSFGDFADAWPKACAAATRAPVDVRPARVAVCTVLPEVMDDAPKCDGIALEWFTDAAHLQRYESQLDACAELGAVLDLAASPVIVATESVQRGADWLEQRWRLGGEKIKHMAIALRAKGLTPAQFSERWRGRAGKIGQAGGAAAIVIPDDARGLAYVQNHPVPRTDGEWAYDALNEVYFDDVASLRKRIDFFRENMQGQAEADLVSEAWFVAAREQVITP